MGNAASSGIADVDVDVTSRESTPFIEWEQTLKGKTQIVKIDYPPAGKYINLERCTCIQKRSDPKISFTDYGIAGTKQSIEKFNAKYPNFVKDYEVFLSKSNNGKVKVSSPKPTFPEIKNKKPLDLTGLTCYGKVVAVHDGDTLTACIHINLKEHSDIISLSPIPKDDLNLFVNYNLRIWGMNAAELNTDKGKAAKKFVEDLLNENNNEIIVRFKGCDKYGGRYLAEVFVEDEKGNQKNLSEELLAYVHPTLGEVAVRYYGDKKKEF